MSKFMLTKVTELVSSRTTSMSWMPKNDFLVGLTKRTSSFLNTEIVGVFLWFRLIGSIHSYSFENTCERISQCF